MILADTSAWVEYDRATGTAVDLRMTGLITDESDELAVSEPIIAEVMIGARSERHERDLRQLLRSFTLLPCLATSDFVGAERIYLACRRAGITPRGLVDCVIAAVALRHQADILTTDADLARIAGVIPLALDPASLQPS